MNKNSFMDELKNLGRQILYTEAENANVDIETVVEIDANGNKKYVTKAGAGPEVKNRLDGKNNFK